MLLNNLYICSDHNCKQQVHIYLNVPCNDAMASGNLSKSYKQLGMKGKDTQIWLLRKSSCFIRPFYGPYRIVEQSGTGVVCRPVDRPQADPIKVAYNRIRHCADSIPDVF